MSLFRMLPTSFTLISASFAASWTSSTTILSAQLHTMDLPFSHMLMVQEYATAVVDYVGHPPLNLTLLIWCRVCLQWISNSIKE